MATVEQHVHQALLDHAQRRADELSLSYVEYRWNPLTILDSEVDLSIDGREADEAQTVVWRHVAAILDSGSPTLGMVRIAEQAAQARNQEPWRTVLHEAEDVAKLAYLDATSPLGR